MIVFMYIRQREPAKIVSKEWKLTIVFLRGLNVVSPDDNVCVVLNDEGKLMGLPLNRALGDYDVIAGTFFVCGYNEENFVGLTPEQFTRYEKFYHDPQLFHRTPFGILVEHCTTERYAAAMDAVSRPRRPPSRQAPER